MHGLSSLVIKYSKLNIKSNSLTKVTLPMWSLAAVVILESISNPEQILYRSKIIYNSRPFSLSNPSYNWVVFLLKFYWIQYMINHITVRKNKYIVSQLYNENVFCSISNCFDNVILTQDMTFWIFCPYYKIQNLIFSID